MAGEIKIWKPDNAFHFSFVVDDVFYIREWKKGLLNMQGDSLQLVPGGEQFANERIYVMLPFPAIPPDSTSSVIPAKAGIQAAQKPLNSRVRGSNVPGKIELPNPILVGTRTQGLFLYDGQTFHSFKTEDVEFLQQHNLYLPGAVLSDGRLLHNTLCGGTMMLDRSRKLLQTIDRSNGLPDNSVYYVYSDPHSPETQWLALNNGIARVEAASPFSTFAAERVRRIRTSERNFYEKVRDIFATSIDYDPKPDYAQQFYATVQNKFHYAIHGHTAAELIAKGIDGSKEFMGLTNWSGKIIASKDAKVAKNYLEGLN